MSLKTNEIIISLLNNKLDEVRGLLASATPGGIDALSPETIATLESQGYSIEESRLKPQFLLDFMFTWWSDEKNNPERTALLHQTLNAYASASLNDYFNGLLILADEVHHQRKIEPLQHGHGLGKTPKPALNALYAILMTEITEKQHPQEQLSNFLNSQRYFLTTPDIHALFPKSENKPYSREKRINYIGYYAALKYRETGATILTALIHSELFSRHENQKFTGSYLEELHDYANAQGKPLRLQLPLSEDQLLRYLDSDTYEPAVLEVTSSPYYSIGYGNDKDPYRKWSTEGKETKFSKRYYMLISLGLSEEKIRTELLKKYLLGIVHEEKTNGLYGTTTRTHHVFPQWQIKGLLKKLGLTINNALIDGEKPVVACFKQRPADVLNHLISVGDLVLNDDDVTALMEAIDAEYKALAQLAQENKRAPYSYELELLKKKIGVIYGTLSSFELHKLNFLKKMHEMRLLPKALEETFEKEEAALTSKITIMNNVCLELSTNRSDPEAIKQAAFDYEKMLKNPPAHKVVKPPKPVVPAEESLSSPSPLPAENTATSLAVPEKKTTENPVIPPVALNPPPTAAPVNQPIDTFRIDFQRFAEGRARDEVKQRLFEELIKEANDQARLDIIIIALQDLDDAAQFKACKEELIRVATLNKPTILELRKKEIDELHKSAHTYLTFILGLGRSKFTFKPTESLTDLDIALGLISPSKLERSYTRLSRWASSKPKATEQTTLAYDKVTKGPQ